MKTFWWYYGGNVTNLCLYLPVLSTELRHLFCPSNFYQKGDVKSEKDKKQMVDRRFCRRNPYFNRVRLCLEQFYEPVDRAIWLVNEPGAIDI